MRRSTRLRRRRARWRVRRRAVRAALRHSGAEMGSSSRMSGENDRSTIRDRWASMTRYGDGVERITVDVPVAGKTREAALLCDARAASSSCGESVIEQGLVAGSTQALLEHERGGCDGAARRGGGRGRARAGLRGLRLAALQPARLASRSRLRPWRGGSGRARRRRRACRGRERADHRHGPRAQGRAAARGGAGSSGPSSARRAGVSRVPWWTATRVPPSGRASGVAHVRATSTRKLGRSARGRARPRPHRLARPRHGSPRRG